MPYMGNKFDAISPDTIVTDMIRDDQVTSAKLDTNIAIDGNLTVDTNTLYVDSTNNIVGIGTTNPSDAGLVIDAKGTASTSASVAFKSNVDTYLRVARFGTASDSSISLGNNYNRNSGSFSADNSSYPVHNINFNTDGSIRFGTGAAGSTLPTERMSIDSSGRVTMPYQPLFMARHSNSTATTGTIVWTSTDFNIGGHYNTSNGRFTAPVAGTYMFLAWTLISNSSSGEVRLQTDVNGSGYLGHRHIDQKPVNSWYTIRSYGMVNLSANDYVSMNMTVNPGTLYGDSNYNGFTMALIA